jgi:hypothetical protein
MSWPILLLLAVMPSITAAFPTDAGQCGWVHGRFYIANGSSLERIWVIGTSHVLAVRDNDAYLPPKMKMIVDARTWMPGESRIYGDFFVCARERWIPGHLQHIRIKKARNLIVRQRSIPPPR